MIDVTNRAYYVTGLGGSEPAGREFVNRLKMGFTFRIYGRHAIGIQYITSLRDSYYPDRADSRQTVGIVGLVYTLLNDTKFNTVEWRSADNR